jgi:5-methylthioadenosine/S-adenosylhomocysteine deaminase
MKKFDLGVYAETLLPMREGAVQLESKRFIGVRGGEIVEVSDWKASRKKECKKFIDGSGKLCLPGFVNGHTHLAMTLFRGLEDDVAFHVWLFERILPLEAAMVSREFVRDGAELAALECIRFGVTTVNEMYFFTSETAKTLDRAGLRAIVSQAMAKFPLPEDKELGSDKFALFHAARKQFAKYSRIEIGLGPHAPYSCGDELLLKVAETARATGAPIHIHLSETAREVEESFKEYGMSPVQRLAKLGVLGKRVICAHCVHLDAKDRELFAASGASAVYNPDSNAKLGSGIAPVSDYLRRNIPVALGTDGAASNNSLSILAAMNLGTKLQKLAAGDNIAMVAAEALRAATFGGAEALGLTNVGSLEPGKRADFILMDLNQAHLKPRHDLVSHLVYSASGLEVSTTVCDGRVLFHEGKFLTLDEKKIYKKADLWGKKIQKRLEAIKK